MTQAILQQLDPSPEPLFELLIQRVDDSMLVEISEADYGHQADLHLEKLLAVKRGEFPEPMKWEPQEVLELIRWSEPDDPDWQPGATGERGHWMRLFSCMVLLRATVKYEYRDHFLGEESTLIQFVDSAIALGDETSHAALQFLSWRMEYQFTGEYDWTTPYFAIAVLFLTVSLDRCTQELEAFLIKAADSNELAYPQLFGECQKWETWHKLTRELLVNSASTSDDLKLFGMDLLGE